MKKIVLTLFALISVAVFSCDENNLTPAELGKQAAIEFCDCYKNDSKDNCLDKLKSKYNESDYLADEFINAFNNESSCGVKLEKITIPQ